MIRTIRHSDCDGLTGRFLTALPVYNEAQHVTHVLNEVVKYANDVLVVDDGSTDGTRQLLETRNDIFLHCHPHNRGYGAALQTAFHYAIHHRYDCVITIDCDGQHEPQRISQLASACQQADIVSGSRYLEAPESTDTVPGDRLQINRTITAELNHCLGLQLTDAFCGFKAYRTSTLANLQLRETGYAMPLELWVQAAWHKLHIEEVAVPLIYLEEERSFGGVLDAADTRLKYYRDVIARAIARVKVLSPGASDPSPAPCCMQNCS